MRVKKYNKIWISLLLLMSILVAVAMVFIANPVGFKAYASELSSLPQTEDGQVQLTILSEMPEDECIKFIVENGIEIPADFVDSSELGSFVKWVIQTVEMNPNYEFLFGYQIAQEFAESIKALINNCSNTTSSAMQGQSSIMAAVAYTLQDNTQYGSWQSNFPNYNCYSYAIGKTNERYRYPGQHSGISNGIFDNYISKYSIVEMANFVKNDLIALGGYGGVYVSNVRPNIISSGETLIAIRKGSSDYHFMKFHPEGGFWTHKPGGTAILRYNYQPADKIWGSEAIINSSGTAQAGSTTYNSEIYYIVYNWSGLTFQGTTITGFIPQIKLYW